MFANFLGGPYDGMKLDHNDINLYCQVNRIGTQVFYLLPPFDEWEAVKRGDKSKNDHFDMLLPYELVRTQAGVVAIFDDQGGRIRQALENFKKGTQSTPVVPFTGAYYRCLRGDVDHIALEHAGTFLVKDEKGRDWFCHQVSQEEAENSNIFIDMFPVIQAQGKAHEKGFSKVGTQVVIEHCESKEELPIKLADILD